MMAMVMMMMVVMVMVVMMVVMIMVVSTAMPKDKDIDNFQAKQKFHNKFKRPTPFF